MEQIKQHNITWGIIGCGDVAEVKSGPAFQKCEGSNLLAVMRRNSEKAADFAKRHNVPLFYDDASKLMDNPEIDSIYVATPPSSHLDYALKVLALDKNLYLEKPMVISVDEALALKVAAGKSKGKLVVAHYRRKLPMYLKIKELIKDNTIGQVQFVDLKYLRAHQPDTNWRLDVSVSGGGYFHDIAPHQIDMMYHLFGDYLHAKGFGAYSQTDKSISPAVNGIIHFKNNVQFRGLWSFNVPKHLEEDTCFIYGSEGLLSFSFFGNEIRITSNKKNEVFNFSQPKHIQQPFIQETVNYFLGKSNNPCNVEEGVEVIKIMDAFTNNIND